MNTLHITVGIVGSGKSTYTTQLSKETGAPVISTDDIRAEVCGGDATDQSKNGYIFRVLIPDRVTKALAVGDAIYDATNYNRQNRKEILNLARSLNARVVAHVFRTPHAECRRRNANRSRVVPDFVIDKQIAGYEDPDMNLERIHEIREVNS